MIFFFHNYLVDVRENVPGLYISNELTQEMLVIKETRKELTAFMDEPYFLLKL